jgi:hypothetical protein
MAGLSPEQRHHAQLVGVAEAYFPNEPAFSHTLKTLPPLLRDDEDVLAGLPGFRARRSSVGILFATSGALIWLKQSFLRRHPFSLRIEYSQIDRVQVAQQNPRRRRLDVFTQTGSAAPVDWFSFRRRDWPSLDALTSVLRRQLGERVSNEFNRPTR